MMEYNGLKYHVGGESLDRIGFDHEKQNPNTLIKFYSNSENSQQALMSNYLYLTHVSQFNDAFEASEHLIDFSLLDKKTYDDFYSEREYLSKPVEYEEDKKMNFHYYRMIFLFSMNYVGNISFTTNKNIDNNLMWSHYASDTGFLVEFDTKKLLSAITDGAKVKHWLFPINYVENLKPINPMDARYGGAYGTLLYLISTKSKDWKYEDEWRLSCYPIDSGYFTVPETLLNAEISNTERILEYPSDCIKRIVLGQKFFNPKNIDCDRYRANTNPYEYQMKEDVELLNYLHSNYNDCLYISSISNNKIKRTLLKIELERKDDVTFILHHQ